MDFSTVADSAVATLSSAVSGAGPSVVTIVGIVAGIGLIIALLRKAAK